MPGLSDQELRERGVPEDVLRLYRAGDRVWQAPLRDLRVDGARCLTEELNDVREVLARKVAETRGRFRRIAA